MDVKSCHFQIAAIRSGDLGKGGAGLVGVRIFHFANFLAKWLGPCSLATAVRVCNAFERCLRRHHLTFHHHKEVAGHPEADELLEWAMENEPLTSCWLPPAPTFVRLRFA